MWTAGGSIHIALIFSVVVVVFTTDWNPRRDVDDENVCVVVTALPRRAHGGRGVPSRRRRRRVRFHSKQGKRKDGDFLGL